MSTILHIIGIDEAGRGPLAGPVSVGLCKVPFDFDFSIFKNLKDSKKLSEKRREEIFSLMEELHEKGSLSFAVSLISPEDIDSKGITWALRKGIEECLKSIGAASHETKILLDGSLKAPEEFLQETIIKGDEIEPVISLASIAAKVTRDRYMVSLAREFPEYGFEVHKGYGTKSHMNAIEKRGLSSAHRKTFCKSFL